MFKIYVGNLPWSATDEDLKELFSQYGEVLSASIVVDKFKGNRSRGFGFVEMSEEEGQAAIEALNGQEYGEEGSKRPLTVNEARPREDRNDSRDMDA